ncbi:hypothetical protein AWB81_08126 [Caballeronia arationis]|nr:hypothetical protein AWB81_08126 [Caballeronia arationis]
MPVELRAPRQIADIQERPDRACGFDPLRRAVAHPSEQGQAEPHGRRLSFTTFENGIPAADRHIDGRHLHAVPLRILDELRGRIKAHRLGVKHRGEKCSRLVTFQPTARIHQQGEARRVTLRKAVLAEALDLFEDGFRKVLFIPTLAHAVDDTVVVLLQAAFALPGGHRTPELIRFTRCETRREDRDLHHLLLENRHAQRAPERSLKRIAGIGDRLESLSAAKIGVNCAPLNRPRSNDRDFDHEIVKGPRLEPRQH